jgi:hypothetical protein
MEEVVDKGGESISTKIYFAICKYVLSTQVKEGLESGKLH